MPKMRTHRTSHLGRLFRRVTRVRTGLRGLAVAAAGSHRFVVYSASIHIVFVPVKVKCCSKIYQTTLGEIEQHSVWMASPTA